MKIIKEYVLGEFLKPLIGCFVLFISLFWIIDLFDHLDEIVKAKVPLFVLCDYYFSLTPFIFVNISPIIIILATIFTLSSLNRHNEIMAIKAIGINLWSIVWIFLTFGIIMSVASFAVNELVKPESYLHSVNLKEEYFKPSADKEKNKIMKDITLYGSHNRIFVINSYDVKRQQLNNIIISESDAANQISKQIAAKRAQWVEGFWIFYDCIISEYENGKLKSEPAHYAEKVILMDEKPKDIEHANLQPELMSYWQLKKYARRLINSGFKADKELVTFYSKLAYPLANFIIIFFAVPFTLTRSRSENLFLGITTSIVISFSYWGINAVCLSLGKIGSIPPMLAAWLTNIIFLFIGIGLIESIKK
ncbi:MAG: LptF/LptG family permease [Candidatus Omnitrophica bacterium]|nr:LptF/LptG family permease [Candidatus Omnitrophota bacterium]MBU4478125.1 LptF/LptG family permease [Candidatus Omnitrophota bacterium]MCG2704044.1 LptF/LptG family permease [Candidatus Omnitrophota bacterium]